MLDLRGAQEWVVTTKLGSSDVRPGTTPVVTRNCRLYAGEMGMSAFVLAAAFYGVFTVNRWTFSIFLFLQVSHVLRRFIVHLAFEMPALKLRSCAEFNICFICTGHGFLCLRPEHGRLRWSSGRPPRQRRFQAASQEGGDQSLILQLAHEVLHTFNVLPCVRQNFTWAAMMDFAMDMQTLLPP